MSKLNRKNRRARAPSSAAQPKPEAARAPAPALSCAIVEHPNLAPFIALRLGEEGIGLDADNARKLARALEGFANQLAPARIIIPS